MIVELYTHESMNRNIHRGNEIVSVNKLVTYVRSYKALYNGQIIDINATMQLKLLTQNKKLQEEEKNVQENYFCNLVAFVCCLVKFET